VREEFTELGLVAEFINGAAFKPEDWTNSGPRIIRIQNLTDPSKPFNRTARKVEEKLYVRPGDLLVSWSATLGVFEWAGPDVAVLNQHIFRVLPNPQKVEQNYLRHALEGALEDMQRHLHGATMQHVNRGEFLATKFYLPPRVEQRRIAEVLDRAEALRTKRRAALTQLDSLIQSIFLELFADPHRNRKSWPQRPMADLFAAPPIFGSMIPPVGERRSWLALRVGNIQNWTLDLRDRKYVDLPPEAVERHSVRDGDLLLARAIASEEHLGKCVVANPGGGRWSFDSHLMRLRFDQEQTEPEFVRHLFMTPGGRRLFLGASRKSTVQFNINTKEISALRIPVPPVALQREFVHRRAAVEKLKSKHHASLAGMNALFAVLQQRAFRGGV
jgi:type I restriction enzyme, S subunit